MTLAPAREESTVHVWSPRLGTGHSRAEVGAAGRTGPGTRLAGAQVNAGETEGEKIQAQWRGCSGGGELGARRVRHM